MNIKQMTKACRVIHRLIDEYSTDSQKKREMLQDPLLLGFFEARFGRMSRQKRIYIGGGAFPKRVDFRHGGSNPVLFEFAVRPPNGVAQLYGGANTQELNKLTRFPPAVARLRVLLLFDFADRPITRDKLKVTYDYIPSSPGRYDRYPVRVIYIHKSVVYNFIWKPYKS